MRGMQPSPRWIATGAALAVALLVGAWPATFVIDGLSMAPGLLPGDVVATDLFPFRDRFRRPRRHERWVLRAADGTPAIKRVVGLPGERVSIAAGDLAIDGRVVLKSPRVLGEMGSIVPEPPAAARPGGASRGLEPAHRWAGGGFEVLDEQPVEPERSRVLLSVRDVGLAVVVRVDRLPPEGFIRVAAGVDETVVPWRVAASGRYAFVAGRLDGHLVAVAWPLPAAAAASRARSCLPADPPRQWDLAEPWPADAAGPPRLAFEVMRPVAAAGDHAVIERVGLWRDGLHRPAADGALAWQVGPEACFVLGDFPSASRDSRHWGDVPLAALRHAVGNTSRRADRE